MQFIIDKLILLTVNKLIVLTTFVSVVKAAGDFIS